MQGFRRGPLVVIFCAAALAFTACGSGGTSSSGSVPGPSVAYVGNASCPTLPASTDPSKPNTYNNGHAPATNGAPVGQPIAEMSHDHVPAPTVINYMHDPPTSGCHYFQNGSTTQLPAPILPGAYDSAIPPENWVHNLEHGYIAVLYNCPTSCTSQFDQLHSWFKALPPDPQFPSACGSSPYAKVIIVPDTTMQPQFAVVSWDWYDPLTGGLDLNEVQRFYDNHVDQGPENAC